jgi:cell division protein FtsW
MTNDARERVKKRFRKKFYIDFGLIFIVIFLLAFGLVMLLSTSSYEAGIEHNDPYWFFKKQLTSIMMGFVAMTAFTVLNYKVLEKMSLPAYIVSWGCVIPIVAAPAHTISANGATRWLRIGPVSVQPAEISKTMIIIFLASFISSLGKKLITTRAFLITIGLAMLPAALVYGITKNLSSALIIIMIAMIMLFVACPGYRRFLLLGALAAGAAALFVFRAVNAESSSELDFRGNRILAWLHPEAYASNKGMQTIQSLYAIGSGGLFGKGLGESMQKLGFIPEAQNDMIFSIICEELGLFGAAAVIVLFILLLYRMKKIADAAPDMFSAMLVVGVMAHIAVQVILNIAVVTNTIPNTGITLPFFSYGGLSLWGFTILLAMFLRIDCERSANY